MPPYTMSELERTREIRLFDANQTLQLPQRVLAQRDFCPVHCRIGASEVKVLAQLSESSDFCPVHCDGLRRCWRNVISAQCSECQSDEVQTSPGKRQE